jgi:hypothetical protein
MKSSAVIWAIAVFLGTNGMGAILYQLLAVCVQPLPDGDCTNRIGTSLVFESMSQEQFAGSVFALSVILSVVAIIAAGLGD